MEITVNEALKLKNEISTYVRKMSSVMQRGVSFGDVHVFVDGEDQTSDGYELKFTEAYDAFHSLLSYSENINSVLATFNVENNISDLVRRKQNIVLLINMLENAQQHSEPWKKKSTENVAGVGKVTKEESFEPDMSQEQINSKISQLNEELRHIDSTIFDRNVTKVRLNFNYDDLEATLVTVRRAGKRGGPFGLTSW